MTLLHNLAVAAFLLGFALLSRAALGLDPTSEPRSVLEHFISRDEGFFGSDTVNRFHLDIDADGLEEVFLSLDSTAGSAGANWLVYSPRSDGRYHFFDHIGLHRYGFRLSSEPPGLDVYWRYAATTGSFMFYSVTEKGFEPIEGTGEISTDAPEATRRFDAMAEWRERTNLIFYFAPIPSLKRGTEVWRQESRPQGYTQDPAPPIQALGDMLLAPHDPQGDSE